MNRIEISLAFPVVGFAAHQAGKIAGGELYDTNQIENAEAELVCMERLPGSETDTSIPASIDCADEVLELYGQSPTLDSGFIYQNGELHFVETTDTGLGDTEAIIEGAQANLARTSEGRAEFADQAGLMALGGLGVVALAVVIARRFTKRSPDQTQTETDTKAQRKPGFIGRIKTDTMTLRRERAAKAPTAPPQEEPNEEPVTSRS